MIENVQTGQRVETVIEPVAVARLGALSAGWRFDWLGQAATSEIYRLLAPTLGGETLGLIALRVITNQFVEVDLLEVNPSDVGRARGWEGIAGSLLAFAARRSILTGGEGYLTLYAKTELLAHYEQRYGFQRVGDSIRMILDDVSAARLIQRYEGGAGQ